jgi:hypothetical protein
MDREAFLKQVLWGCVMAWILALMSVSVLLAGEGPEPAAKSMVEETEWPNVTAELTSVERSSGNMLTIKFKYTNAGSDQVEIARLGQYSHDNVLDHVYYIDAKNKKKYLVVKDAEKKALGTNLKYFTLAPGESKAAWGKFPEPPADVQKISVYLPGAPPFEDVPIR